MKASARRASATRLILAVAWQERWVVILFIIGAIVALLVGLSRPHQPPALAVVGGARIRLIGGQLQEGKPWLWLLQYGLFLTAITHLVGSTGSRSWMALQRVRGIAPDRWALGQLLATGVLAVLWVGLMAVCATVAAALGGGALGGASLAPGLAVACAGLWAASAVPVVSQRLLGDARAGLLATGLLILMAASGPLVYWTPFGYALSGILLQVPWARSFGYLLGWSIVCGMVTRYPTFSNLWP